MATVGIVAFLLLIYFLGDASDVEPLGRDANTHNFLAGVGPVYENSGRCLTFEIGNTIFEDYFVVGAEAFVLFSNLSTRAANFSNSSRIPFLCWSRIGQYCFLWRDMPVEAK